MTRLARVFLAQLLDQPGGFEFVQQLDALAEAFGGEVLDLLLVEPVFLDNLQDEFLLLLGTVPPLRYCCSSQWSKNLLAV